MNSSFVFSKKKIKRTFLPGDEWLFFKAYTSDRSADSVILYLYRNVIKHLLKHEIINDWFFIRYQDPEYHLRVRFLLSDVSLTGEVIVKMNKAIASLVNNKRVNKLTIDTYERELERYGYFGIEFTERLFSAESSFIMRILPTIMNADNGHLRWLTAIKVIDVYLSLFLHELDAKIDIMGGLSMAHKHAFHFNEFNAKCFNYMYRSKYMMIHDVLQDSYNEESWFTVTKEIKKYSDEIRKLVSLPCFIDAPKKNEASTVLIVGSYVHMLINRLIDSNTKLVELVIYEFLYRYYKSLKARSMYYKPCDSLDSRKP